MKRLITTVVPLGAIVLLVLAVSAWAAPTTKRHTGGDHRGQGRTITVIEHATTDTTTDTGAKGDSVGDILTFANEVFDAADATKVGTDNGYCLRTVRHGRRLRVQLDDLPRRRPDHGRGPVLRRQGQHARDHRRHRPLPRRPRRDGAPLARERREVRVRLPPQGLSHSATSATNSSGAVSIAA